MKREIKFKAWHRESKVMYWFELLWGNHGHGNGYIGMVEWGKEQSRPGNYRGNMTLVDPMDCEIMQFTGLRDRNGIEIYEGDWCEAVFRDENGFHVVQGQIFIDEYMCCLDNSHNRPECEIYSINRLYDFLVLGNIYEHPHLINQPA